MLVCWLVEEGGDGRSERIDRWRREALYGGAIAIAEEFGPIPLEWRKEGGTRVRCRMVAGRR